jgi:transcriptional regulator with XRE-family HTH domain
MHVVQRDAFRFILMHYCRMDQRKLRQRIIDKMMKEGLSQRALAHRVGMSQGHLSKVLRLGFRPRARVNRALLEWLEASPDSASTNLIPSRSLTRAIGRATEGSPEAMQIVTEVMHLLGAMRRVQ